MYFGVNFYISNTSKRVMTSTESKTGRVGVVGTGARSVTKGKPIAVVGLTSLVAMGAIYWSHYSQIQDKAVMREGVERDKERMRQKRRLLLQQQEQQEQQQK